MVRYNNKQYPQNISCEINEISGHFDKKLFTQKNRYSLHTEYSYAKRKFDNILLDGLNEIKTANVKGVPQLWKNKIWANEFFIFIQNLLCNSIEPEIIEIHPPFVDYCNTIDEFLNVYETFETLILGKYNNTKIFIENRYGTQYGSKFLISNCEDIIGLCKKISVRRLQLRITLDYPQLMSSERINLENTSIDKILNFNNEIKSYNELFAGVHLWGKKMINNRLLSHIGNFNTLFHNNIQQKKIFLESMQNVFDDENIRYMVLEVNSSISDLHDIINDLENSHFNFV